jgi:hypothetical protein
MEDQNRAPSPTTAKAALEQRRSVPRRSGGVLRETNAADSAAALAAPRPARACGPSLAHAAAADDSGSSVVISSDSESDAEDERAAAGEARPTPGASGLLLAFQRLQQGGGTPAGSSARSEARSRRSASPAMYSAASSWAPSSLGSDAVGTASAPRRSSPPGSGGSPRSAGAGGPGRQLLFSATPQQQLQATPTAAAPASALLATRQVRRRLAHRAAHSGVEAGLTAERAPCAPADAGSHLAALRRQAGGPRHAAAPHAHLPPPRRSQPCWRPCRQPCRQLLGQQRLHAAFRQRLGRQPGGRQQQAGQRCRPQPGQQPRAAAAAAVARAAAAGGVHACGRAPGSSWGARGGGGGAAGWQARASQEAGAAV